MALKTVDIKGIGFYSLGKYRKNMSDQKKDEYLAIFTKYFLKTSCIFLFVISPEISSINEFTRKLLASTSSIPLVLR